MSVISAEQRQKEIEARQAVDRRIDEEEKKRREAATLFDIDEFIADADLVREVYVEEIDRRVRYKKLTVAENAQLSRISDREKRGMKMLEIMLSKANPKVTEEQIERIGSDVAAVILAAILDHQGFLQSAM